MSSFPAEETTKAWWSMYCGPLIHINLRQSSPIFALYPSYSKLISWMTSNYCITVYKWSWYIHLPVYQTNDIRNIHIVHLVQLILTLGQSILKFVFFIVSSKQSRISYTCSSILFQSIYILIMWRKQVDIILNSDSIYRLKKKHC
jgi:hypothetical protein